MSASKQVWDAALALPEEARVRLAYELLHSVGHFDAVEDDPEVIAELERRAQQVADGTATLIDWPTMRARLRAEFGRRGPR